MSKKITITLAALSCALIFSQAGLASESAQPVPAAALKSSITVSAAAIQPVAITDNRYQGTTVNISLPYSKDSCFQKIQDFFSSNVARSLYAHLPYYTDEYGQINPFYLKNGYTFEEIKNIATISDFIHKRMNREAEARQEFSNRYDMVADYDVTLNNSDYLSLLQSVYTYSGGAHGLTVRYSMTMDRATGKTVQLNDLFADKNYLSVLNSLIDDQNTDIHFFQKVRLSGNEEFYLTDKGLTVYFQVYEVAPYAAGFIEYFFPYDTIAPFMYKK